jgi:arginine exporter protein ArgO
MKFLPGDQVIMKTAFITSLASALMSLIGVFGLSTMTSVPRLDPECWRSLMMILSGIFFLIWCSLAIWLRPRPNLASRPSWMLGLTVSVEVVYVFGVLLFVIG